MLILRVTRRPTERAVIKDVAGGFQHVLDISCLSWKEVKDDHLVNVAIGWALRGGTARSVGNECRNRMFVDTRDAGWSHAVPEKICASAKV